MKAYHIRTNEPDSSCIIGSATGLSCFTLDSLFVPDRKILLGYVNWENKRGMIKNYPGERYCERAEAIVNKKKGVNGDVISKINLEEGLVNQIFDNIPMLETKRVKLNKEFDGSTNDLIYVLTGKQINQFRTFLYAVHDFF